MARDLRLRPAAGLSSFGPEQAFLAWLRRDQLRLLNPEAAHTVTGADSRLTPLWV